MIMVPEVIWFDRTDGAKAKNGGGENSEIVMKPNRTDVENENEELLCFEAGTETVSKLLKDLLYLANIIYFETIFSIVRQAVRFCQAPSFHENLDIRMPRI